MLGNRALTDPTEIDHDAGPLPATQARAGGSPAADGRHRPRPTAPSDRSWSMLAFAAVVLVLLACSVAWIVIASSGGSSGSTTIDQASLDGGSTTNSTPTSAGAPAGTALNSASVADQQAAASLVSAARQGASAYPDVAAARAAGYRSASTLSGEGEELGVGYEIRLTDANGQVNPSSPNGIVYRRTASGVAPVGEVFLGVSGHDLAQPAGSLAAWRPTVLRTRAGQPVEVLTVWFGPGVNHPFAASWRTATAA